MSATAGTLTLIVDSTSVSAGERALDSIARTGARVEGSLKIDMGSIERAMERLGQKVTSLDQTMTAGMGRVSAAGQAQARTFEALRASIDPAYAASQRFRQVQQELAGMVERGEASQRAANIVLEQASSRYMGVATASERAAEAERKAAQATAMASQGYEQLRASVDPLYAASKRYEAAIDALDAAQKAGAITDRDRARTLQLLEARMIQTGQSTVKTTGFFSKMFASVGGGQMALKQTAFQLNQIAQQGAVTGQWMSAISVQSADLLTVFGTWGILMGGVIALGGPLITSLITSGEKAKTLKDRFDDLSESASAYQSALTATQRSVTDLYGEFGRLEGRARDVLALQLELAEFAAVQSQKAAIAGVVDEFGRLQNVISLSNDELDKQLAAFARYDPSLTGARATRKEFQTLGIAVNDITGELDISKESAVEFAVAMRAAANADDPSARADALGRARAALMAAAKEQGGLNDLGAKYLGLLTDAELAALALAAGQDQVTRSALASADAASSLSSQLSVAASEALKVAMALSAAPSGIEGLENKAAQLTAQIAALDAGQTKAAASAAGYRKQLEQTYGLADAATAAEEAYISGVINREVAAYEKVAQLNDAYSDRIKELNKAASAGSKHARQIERELEAVRKSLSPLSAYNEEMAKLTKLRGYLTDDEFAQAIRNLNVELADSLPLVGELTDSVVEGLFNGFDGTLDNIKSIFKSWLIEMVSMAAKNQIILNMGLNPMGSVGSAVSTAGVAGGGTGSLGVLGQIAGIGGSIFSGASGLLSSLFGAGGGIGAAGTYLSAVLGSATTSIGAFGAALGAIALPVAAVAAVFSFFSTKTKLLDSGLRITASNMDLLIQTFSTVEKSKFWGLSKKVSTSYGEVDAATAAVLEEAIGGIMTSVQDYAAVLGIGGRAFREFAHVVEVSTKGMTDEEAQQAVLDAMTDLSDAYAGMVPNIERFAKTGEGATETLTRLATSLTTVNDLADLLGHRLFDVSLVGADAASRLADYFGDLDTMTSAVTTYWQTVYSESEQSATTVRRLTSTFAELGYAMPRSRDQYRALVDSIDTSTDAGMELYASMINLAGAMDAVLPTVASITAELEALTGTTQTSLDLAISTAEAAAKANATAASNWYKASDSIESYIDKLRGSSTALTSPMQARAYNEATYQTTLAAALAGDLTAAGNLTGVAENLRQSVNATAGTRVEAALTEARILSDLGLAAGVGDIEGARHDVIAGLLTDQADLMQEVADYIAAGNELTDEMIATLGAQLGALDDAIAAAELINYAYLKDRLEVTVDVLADADVPKYLRNLLTSAADGVTGYIDFLVRSDLTPDLKWLALVGASEHVKTIEYLADNRLGIDLTRLAVETISDLQKTVNLLVGEELPSDVMRIALAGSSELSRIVTATLSADIDPAAKRLALTDLSEHVVEVSGKIATGSTRAMKRLLRSLGGSSDGNLTLGGSFVFDPSASFETLLGDTIEVPMEAARAAMGTLTGALDDLRAAIAAETARAEYESKVASLQMSGDAAASALASTKSLQSSTADELTALFASLGVSTVGGSIKVKNGQLTETYDHLVTSGSWDPLMEALRSTYGVKGGTVSDLMSKIFDQVNSPLDGQRTTLKELRRAYRQLTGEAPSFDGGGYTGAGSRSGGLDGKGGFLAMLHPQERVVDEYRGQSLGAANGVLLEKLDELIADNKALRAEVRSLKEEQRQLGMQTADNTRTSARIARKWDRTGIPEERT